MQCIIMENTLIKLTLHDETKKRAHEAFESENISIYEFVKIVFICSFFILMLTIQEYLNLNLAYGYASNSRAAR